MSVRYEVYAIKYATVDRVRQSNFTFAVEDGADQMMALDFFVWLARSDDALILIDTGFSPASGLKRGRSYLRSPADSILAIGYKPQDVTDLVLTHLHFDHAGNISDFPAARIWVQKSEVNHVTNRLMGDPGYNGYYSAEDVCSLIGALFEGRVNLLSGPAKVREGIELYHVGGHTVGLQVARIFTERGWIVIASDAVHYMENFIRRNPFPVEGDIESILSAFDRVRQLADSERHIIPSHDPGVCSTYPSIDVGGVWAYRVG